MFTLRKLAEFVVYSKGGDPNLRLTEFTRLQRKLSSQFLSQAYFHFLTEFSSQNFDLKVDLNGLETETNIKSGTDERFCKITEE